MKQPKWIGSIEVTDQWQPGYWVVRGWDREARMKTVSVIGTIEIDEAVALPEEGKIVQADGIAHAGARGISKLETSVDNGPWRQAELFLSAVIKETARLR